MQLDKPKGTYRIAVIGDSLTWGNGVLRGERFGDLLQARLGQRSDLTYQVLNFGMAGWDTVHELEVLRTLVLKASPDFVLLQWYVNDFENGDRESPTPHFPDPVGFRECVPAPEIGAVLETHGSVGDRPGEAGVDRHLC